MPQGPRVLFIGLDSAEPELLFRWAAQGHLPNVARLLASGASAPITAPRGFGNGVVWPSLFTGSSPGHHGRYYFRQLKPGTYDIEPFASDEQLLRRPFWEALSDAGLAVGVVDVVRAPLSPRLNGLQLADWLTHDATDVVRSMPRALAAEVIDRFGSDPLSGGSDRYSGSGRAYADLRDRLCRRVRQKSAMCAHHLATADWSLFMTVFGEPHDIGHMCWHLHDPGHARHAPGWVRTHGDPVLRVYREVDRGVGELLDAVDPQTHVALFSGPGMGMHYTGNPLLEEVLCRLDEPAPAGAAAAARRLKAGYRRWVPAPVRRTLHRLSRPVSEPKAAEARRRQRWFSVPHNLNSGAVRINLKGREPDGRVAPGDYAAVCDELAAELHRLNNPATGRPAVAEVVRVHERFSGENLDRLPDLLVVWNRESPIDAVESPGVGRVEKSYSGPRTGDHTPHCLFLLAGPGIGGERHPEFRVEDVAPTVAALLDVRLTNAEGRSRLDQFRRETGLVNG